MKYLEIQEESKDTRCFVTVQGNIFDNKYLIQVDTFKEGKKYVNYKVWMEKEYINWRDNQEILSVVGMTGLNVIKETMAVGFNPTLPGPYQKEKQEIRIKRKIKEDRNMKKELLERLWEAQDKLLMAVNTESREASDDLIQTARSELREIYTELTKLFNK